MAAASASNPVCPVCRGTGWKAAPGGGTGVVRCECHYSQRAAELVADAGIPPRYQHCTLENFELPDGARELRLAHGQAAAYARDYPGLVDRDRSGLLFFGTVGAGKTHLAAAIAHKLLERGIACRFVDHRELLKQIQSTFDPANPATESGVVRPLLEVDVLLIDDLGVGRATEWALETLHYILNHRYTRKRATIVTTNLEEGAAKGSLEHGVGERLRSRLHEMCVFVAMHGSDFRRTTAAPVVR